MEEEKKKLLEKKLNQLIAEANVSRSEIRSIPNPQNNARVIRRRKGKPDMKVA